MADNGIDVTNYPVKNSDESSETVGNPKRLSDEIVSILESRLADEYTAHYFYMNVANWCNGVGYFKAGAFFAKESDGELEHAKGIQDYLVKWNVFPKIPTVKTEYPITGLPEAIKEAYALEYDLYQKYNENSKKILSKDPSTFDFLSKYRTIQTDSVAEFSDLLNALELINPSNKLDLLYFEERFFGG